MYISNLAIEVTRRCNLKCKHCLRGPAQGQDINIEILDNVFRQIDGVGILIITGGEPSLVPNIIILIRDSLLRYNVDLDSFYIVTNGKNSINRNKLLNNLYILRELCNCKEECSLYISNDYFHQEQRGKPNLKYTDCFILNDIIYWGNEKIETINEIYKGFHNKGYMTNIINEGYAKKNKLGTYNIKQKPWLIYTDNDIIDSVTEEVVYISANGNVVSCCDLSYNTIDKEHKGNILDKRLYDIINDFSEIYIND